MNFLQQNFDGITSLFAACLEFVLFINVIIFAEKNHINNKVKLLLLLLILYQIFEFSFCFLEVQNNKLVFAAFVLISLLPPLVLNLIISLHEFVNVTEEKNIYKYIAFLPILGIDIFYFFLIDSFKLAECNVFYAIYYYPMGFLFGTFYYLPILISIIILFAKFKDSTKFKSELNALRFGFLLTFVPAWILEIISHQILIGIVSILCKFAVILAFSLTYFALKFRMNNKETPKENI
ncbi:MAG: hypothetical protein CO129_09630 [Ignavibacteriales bacterium CG_4_9_14_3_um_filter_34_10]|nr:MAG: hypothetical protein CO129_09630 [Ignavibacteriales bacterium CG_4_9_14_3_um_filter_34_10]